MTGIRPYGLNTFQKQNVTNQFILEVEKKWCFLCLTAFNELVKNTARALWQDHLPQFERFPMQMIPFKGVGLLTVGLCEKKMVQSMSSNSQTTPPLLRVTLVLLAYLWPIGSRCQRSSKKRRCAQGISMLKHMKDIGRFEPEIETFLWPSGLRGLASGELAQGVPWILF